MLNASSRVRGALIVLALLGVASPVWSQRRGQGPAQPASGVPRFQWIGPQPAGRIAAVAGVAGDTSIYYMGAASGGVWKTADGGRTFAPVFDDQPVQAIGALAVANSNPRIVWAGTGEAWAIRDSDLQGDGVYKSTDAGATWTNMGLRETGRIGRIVIHPSNPDIVYVCALGRATGSQEDRGVYRTTDGGAHWTRVLFVNPETGCSGLAIDPTDPKILVAGTWEVVMHTWAMFSGGAGSGVYVSRDSGSTWTHATTGLPVSPVGKIDVAVAPSNPKRMFALIQTANQGSLWRSDDAGTNWKVVSWDRRLIGRAGYYIRVMVNPQNDNEVLVASSSLLRSFDGGETFPTIERGCGDCHDIWLDPRNPSHWVLTGDGGAGITRNHGQSYFNLTLPIGQMYHVAIDNRVPYWVYANRQDDGTMRGANDSPIPVPNVPSYNRGPALPSFDDFGGPGGGGTPWQPGLGGCESGFTIPVPSNPDIVWSTCYGSTVTRFDDRIKRARHVSPGIHTLDSPPTDVKYRCHWTPPLAIDPFDNNAVYFGCQVIFKTVNQGQSWTVISPDLSTRDTSRIVSSGGIVGDNLGQFYGEVVFAITPSELQKGLIWAGTNDGKIWNTKDGGGTWTDVTGNISGLRPWGTVRRIEPSRFNPGTAYVAIDYHLMDHRLPYIYRTTDYGKTWSKISDGLPQDHPLDYVLTVAENPNRKGMLFAGTGHGFYYSMDDGGHWTAYKEGLPATAVTWIVVSKPMHDVVVSTYGRGLYVMHDITTLEQDDKVASDAPVHLYEPRPGTRLGRTGSADFNVKLAAAPKDSLKVEIMDSTGAVVRTMRTAGRQGTNRLSWDMHYDAPRQVELKTTPPDNPHIWEEARFKNGKPRPIIHWGIEGPVRAGPLANNGRYSVRLTADGTAQTQPFSVIRDPSLPATETDLALSTRAQVRIRDRMNETVDMINKLETMRRQLEDQMKADGTTDDVKRALRALDEKALKVELLLLSKSDLHSDDKWYVEKYKIYLNLVWLNGEVGTGAGDVQGGADYRPTDASMATLMDIEKDLESAKVAFKQLMDTDVKAFNETMAGKAKVIMDQ
ncbi:MAG: hypothetical protein U0132_14690 [Gemmatimonadaceae bacterium]